MPRVHAVIAGISLWMARAGGALLIIASAVITFEIVARKFFLLPFNVGTELSTYALAVGASWSFATRCFTAHMSASMCCETGSRLSQEHFWTWRHSCR